MGKGKIYLGTSGWTYEHWKNVFYPDSIARKKWFEFYCTYFPTVELNASFYRIPTLKAAEGWYSRSPEHFRFAVKMSRLVTHERKLKNCERELEWFFSVFEPLKKKIAVYLIQLPPTLKFDPERLLLFSKLLPKDNMFAVEFRNPAWYRDETMALLKELHFAFCIHDMGGVQTERVITSHLIYIRFHGYDSQYGGDYSDQHLLQWATWIKQKKEEGKQVHAYFNNDIGGFAIKNCLKLQELCNDKNKGGILPA